MLRRLEDRIRELCAKSITASDDELGPRTELRAALREHAERFRKVVAATNFANAKNRLRLERRSRSKQSPPQEGLPAPPKDVNKKRKSA
jgi:hypothetical protein